MINQLTKSDALIYKNGLDIFENHARYVETKYSFNLLVLQKEAQTSITLEYGESYKVFI